jgi:hypothetical protein
MAGTRGTPVLGSRSAHDVTDPDLHASDIEDAAFTVHLDPAAAEGEAMVMGGAGEYVATNVVTAAELPHAVLSATHTDTTPAAAVRGDIIVGIGASPVWTRYPLSVPAAGTLNYLGINNGEDEPTWKSASANPGAAAAILATDADGFVDVEKLTTSALVSIGANLGYVRATAVREMATLGLWVPREASASFVFYDFLDEAAYWDKQYTSMTITPAPDSGTATNIYRDDVTYIQWNSASSPYPIVIEVDSATIPITAKLNALYQLGLTFRSYASNPSHVKIELWDTGGAAYTIVYDEDVTIPAGNTYWLSPGLGAPVGSSSNVVKLKVTLTGTNPLDGHLLLQRLMLYHSTAAFDPWHLHVGGGTVYGAVTMASTLAVTGAITPTGNITMPNGGTIGRAAGPLLTFNDTTKILTLSGGVMNVSGGSSGGVDVRLSLLTVGNGGAGRGTALDIQVPGSASSEEGARIAAIATGGVTTSQTADLAISVAVSGTLTERMRIKSTGHALIGTTSDAAQLAVDQSSTTGALPVLLLDQGDVSEEFLRLIGTSAADNSQSLIDAADLTTPGAIVGWLKVYIQDDASSGAITDGYYFVPFYAAPTA